MSNDTYLTINVSDEEFDALRHLDAGDGDAEQIDPAKLVTVLSTMRRLAALTKPGDQKPLAVTYSDEAWEYFADEVREFAEKGLMVRVNTLANPEGRDIQIVSIEDPGEEPVITFHPWVDGDADETVAERLVVGDIQSIHLY